MHSGHIYKVFSTRPQKASSSILILKSELFDRDGKLAVSKMLDVHEKHQCNGHVIGARGHVTIIHHLDYYSHMDYSHYSLHLFVVCSG